MNYDKVIAFRFEFDYNLNVVKVPSICVYGFCIGGTLNEKIEITDPSKINKIILDNYYEYLNDKTLFKKVNNYK